jgi:hypothetical protein
MARVQDTTGGSARGRRSQGGLGNVGEPMVSLGTHQASAGRPARGRLPAGRGGVCLAHEPCASKGPEATGAPQGLGEGPGAPHAPERGSWQS